MEIKLDKNFEVYGNTLEGFFDAIESMDAATQVHNMYAGNIAMAAVLTDFDDALDLAYSQLAKEANNNKVPVVDVVIKLHEEIKNYNQKERIRVLYMPLENSLTVNTKSEDDADEVKIISGASPYLSSFKKSAMYDKDVTHELLKDLETDTKMLMYVDDDGAAIVSPLAFTTLLRRAGLGGDAFNKPCLGRVVEMYKSFQYRYPDLKVNVITRKRGRSKIVLAVHSDKYCYIKQCTLKDIYNEIASRFGTPKCEKWFVNHEISCCYISFPEMAEKFSRIYKLPHDVVPGLYLATSDSGDSSMTIKGFWKFGGHIITGKDEEKQTHRGDIDIPEYIEDVKNSIYSKYQRVPERLCDLLALNCPDPETVLRKVMKSSGITKLLGSKRDIILQALRSEFVKGYKYTAYHIALIIASIPERIRGFDRTTVQKLENAAIDAIFSKKYEELLKNETPEEVLAP